MSRWFTRLVIGVSVAAVLLSSVLTCHDPGPEDTGSPRRVTLRSIIELEPGPCRAAARQIRHDREPPIPIVLSDEPIVVSPDGFSPAVADIDGDGDLELLGADNVDGRLEPITAAELGLEELFANERHSRDNRLVDLDGDGDLDLVANGYDKWSMSRTRALLFWNEGGRFTIDSEFRDLDIRGHGETILAFDFDNDEDIDIYLPHYSSGGSAERGYLLENRGRGEFVDVADQAGVAIRGMPHALRVEGAQAADINGDGWIDFYAASHLFLNRGDGTFLDARELAGLPPVFDEGMRFLDWNADGALDIVLQRSTHAPVLFEQDGIAADASGLRIPHFTCVAAFPHIEAHGRYGINAFDLNNDGLEEILVGAGGDDSAVLLRHTGERYALNAFAIAGALDRATAGDFDGDGRLDLVAHSNARPQVFRNLTPGTAPAIRVRVLGSSRAWNQHGRVARLTSTMDPTFVVTRIVDSGSGYMAQSDYDLHFASPFAGVHQLSVEYATGVVVVHVSPGDTIEITPP